LLHQGSDHGLVRCGRRIGPGLRCESQRPAPQRDADEKPMFHGDPPIGDANGYVDSAPTTPQIASEFPACYMYVTSDEKTCDLSWTNSSPIPAPAEQLLSYGLDP